VDEFLDAICDEMVRQMDEIAALKQQLAAAKAARPVVEAPTQQIRPIMHTSMPVHTPAPVAQPVAEKNVPDSDFREILEMAQKVKRETIAAAEAKAEEIVTKAREEATAKLENLDVEKETLTKQVAALKAAAAEYRAKFESLLQAQQEAIEKASDLF